MLEAQLLYQHGKFYCKLSRQDSHYSFFFVYDLDCKIMKLEFPLVLIAKIEKISNSFALAT